MTPTQLFIASLFGQFLTALILYRQGSATHQLINSRLTAMLRVVGTSERAKGVLEGRRQQQKKMKNIQGRPK